MDPQWAPPSWGSFSPCDTHATCTPHGHLLGLLPVLRGEGWDSENDPRRCPVKSRSRLSVGPARMRISACPASHRSPLSRFHVLCVCSGLSHWRGYPAESGLRGSGPGTAEVRDKAMPVACEPRGFCAFFPCITCLVLSSSAGLLGTFPCDFRFLGYLFTIPFIM